MASINSKSKIGLLKNNHFTTSSMQEYRSITITIRETRINSHMNLYGVLAAAI